jgi:hypothetical protein
MARTFIRQDTQIRNSDLYDDTLDRSLAETNATTIEDDLNYLRSQFKYITGKTAWYQDLSDDFDLTDIHDKRFTYWVQKTDDVAVPNGQNYVTLSGSTKPSSNIAIGATSLGAVVAQLAGAIGANDTTAAANNGNVLEIRDAATNDPIYTSGNQVYGLLQVGSAATDGNAFADAGNDQGQISFVYLNPATEAWTAVPVADIEDKTIEYAYKVRTDFYNLPENAFDPSVSFVDTDLDLQDVYDNDADGQFDLTTGKNWTANLNSGAADWEVIDGAVTYIGTDNANSALFTDVDLWLKGQAEARWYDSDSSNYVGFEAAADLAGDQIWVLPVADGTDGQVIYTDGSGNLGFKDAGGEVKKAWRIIDAANIAANTPIDISTFTNPDSMVFGTDAATWQKDYDVYVNGVLQLSAQSGASDYDVYWVSNTTIAFEYVIKKNDVVQIVQRK